MKQYFKLLLLFLSMSSQLLFAASTALQIGSPSTASLQRQRSGTPVRNSSLTKLQFSPVKYVTREEYAQLQILQKREDVLEQYRLLRDQVNFKQSQINEIESYYCSGKEFLLIKLQLYLEREEAKLKMLKLIPSTPNVLVSQLVTINNLKREIEALGHLASRAVTPEIRADQEVETPSILVKNRNPLPRQPRRANRKKEPRVTFEARLDDKR